ncbi:helix-turn-helix domain-containing protein [Arsenicibacter rosenii]|uniref:HTH araC/xylS-type domain-containing protein n=1 Tax=Arsenicibacter rosenii TaxID=1750698 RepID=A0A1S2VBW4_9BACT|nr:helix-turn-helix domain-containing protein [Arsenicibacter rosenii]OIN55910.1 hypothetical protein BLX24_27555 [Arsenicibacter rosenii]
MVTPEQSQLSQLNQVIDEQMSNPAFGIDELCRTLGISRSNLFRLLKEQTGLAPSLYIRQLRLAKARDLLEHTDLRITDVAFQVGFERSQMLSKYFTEAYGISPSEFRTKQVGADGFPAVQHESPTPDTDVFPVVDQQPEKEQPPVPVVEEHVITLPAVQVAWYRRRQVQLVALALLLVLLVAGWFSRLNPFGDNTPAASSIAVLPFRNTGAADTYYFSSGIMQQIHSSLSRLENLKVISQASAMLYEKTTKTPAEIAGELDVAYLLEGEVLQVGQRVKLSVELILAADNRTVWSNTYEGDEQHLFGFMGKVSGQIARELNQQLSQAMRQQLKKAPTQNMTAYNEYLKGQYLLRNRSREGILGSLVNFDRALTLDPGYADAHAGKAMAHFLLLAEGINESRQNKQLAEKEALDAIRLDAQNAQAYLILAKLYQAQGKWEQAKTTFQIALQYSPNDALINYSLSLLLRTIGQVDGAIDYSTKAYALDPLLPVILMGHVGNLLAAGQYEEARKLIAEGNRLHQQVANWYWTTAAYYFAREQYELSLQELDKGLAISPATKAFLYRKAITKARMGQPEETRAILDTLPDIVENYAYRAEFYAGLKDKGHCLAYLEKGLTTEQIPLYLKVAPLFSFLHGDPRFTAILHRAGLDGPVSMPGQRNLVK